MATANPVATRPSNWTRMIPPVFEVLAAIGCAYIAIYSYRYILGIGWVPHLTALNRMKQPFLMIHLCGAATALLIMPLQIVPQIRNRWPVFHRWVGRVYVLGCVVGAIGGFMLAIGAVAGRILNVGFAVLAIVWLTTTLLGWRAARQEHFGDHRKWMIRSFALTFAAVTLRLYIPVSFALHLPFIPSYQAIAWLCWVPNLIVAEVVLALSGIGRSQPVIAQAN